MSCRSIFLICLFLGHFSLSSFCQESTGFLDRLTTDNSLDLILRPIGSPQDVHQMKLRRSETGAIMASYSYPILWMGEGMRLPEPVSVADDIEALINLLIQQAQLQTVHPPTSHLPERLIVYNWYAQPYWEALFHHIEHALFGDYILQQKWLRDQAAQQESLKLLGEYRAVIQKDSTYNTLNIWLTKYDASDPEPVCIWSIQQDEVIVSGACRNGLAGRCGWRLVPAMGTWRLLLNEEECTQLWGHKMALNFGMSFSKDGAIFLTTFDPIMFFEGEAKRQD